MSIKIICNEDIYNKKANGLMAQLKIVSETKNKQIVHSAK